MALIGHGTKKPRITWVDQTRESTLKRQIRADIPVPTSRQPSAFHFMHEMHYGESFLAYGSKERSNAASYGRANGWKIITRIEQRASMEKNAMIYRIWKVAPSLKKR
jgi:hypothetical protein